MIRTRSHDSASARHLITIKRGSVSHADRTLGYRRPGAVEADGWKPRAPGRERGYIDKMPSNRYFRVWPHVIGLHAIHQLEESISFFSWYVENAKNIPRWLLIVSVENAVQWVQHPAYFALASLGQILAVAVVAFVFRRRERLTRYLISLYVAGLAFFLVWHVVTAYLAHSYAPVMVTCVGGIYLIPTWIKKLLV